MQYGIIKIVVLCFILSLFNVGCRQVVSDPPAPGSEGTALSGGSEGGVSSVSEGGVSSVSEGGVSSVSEGGVSSVSEGGVSSVSEGGVSSVSEGGVSSVSEGGVSSVSEGGVSSVSEGGVSSVSEGGVSSVSEGGVSSVSAGSVPSGSAGSASSGSEGEIHDSKNEQEISFDFCSFPNSLKTAVEKKLGKNCSLVTSADLAQIKEIKLENVDMKMAELLVADYSSYFSALNNLDISDNPKLLVLPDFVTSITTLKKLNISNTGITNLSGKMCQLENLSTLIASHNNYEGREMPMAVFCLRNLKKLDMSHSSLLYIDEYVYYLKNLEELHLRGNQLVMLPGLLNLMPTLLLLDLRDNKLNWEPVNSLYDCTTIKNADEIEKCQEELFSSISCEWWYEMPDEWSKENSGFQRAKASFIKRYEQMTGDEYKDRHECPECARCFNSWLNDYVFYDGPDKQYLLDLTVNGKTMREWRLFEDERNRHTTFFDKALCTADIKGISWRNGISTSLHHVFTPRGAEWAPNSEFIHPERLTPLTGEDMSKDCSPINEDIPVSSQPAGPWVSALPVVQPLVDKYYPLPQGCENWTYGNTFERCPAREEELERKHAERMERYKGYFIDIWNFLTE